jgi:hypothetical protein
MDQDDQTEPSESIRKLRHSLRGSINAMKLGITVLEIGLPPSEAEEFLGYIEDAATSICAHLDEYDKVLETAGRNDAGIG